MTELTSAATHARTLLHLLRQDALDAAIEAGLMAWTGAQDDGLSESERALLARTRERIDTAWQARERFRARQARVQQRESERRARRAAAMAAPAPPASEAPAVVAPAAPALPAAATAILARARARAGVASQ